MQDSWNILSPSQVIDPKKLPWKNDETNFVCFALKSELKKQIVTLIEHGFTNMLCGMAEGVDTWASEAFLELRKTDPAIKLHCILPCKVQSNAWNASSQERYYSILEQADAIIYVNRENKKNCMLDRDRFLVSYSSALLAVYNGEYRGGTAATIRYARKLGREIYIINPSTLEMTHEAAKLPQGNP